MPENDLQPLTPEIEHSLISEAVALLEDPGILIHNTSALELLADSGAAIDLNRLSARLPAEVIQDALDASPKTFTLYNQQGEAGLEFSPGQSCYAPGSAALTVLDRCSGRIRPGLTPDLTEFIKAVESLDQISAQSTAIVPGDVPAEIADLYRLYLVLTLSSKPIITGAFQVNTLRVMIEMLAAAAGGAQQLSRKPRALFDICPTSPLQWGETASQNLIDCSRSGIPVQIVPMPLAGASSPVTLAGTIVQHAAECLSGVVLAQASGPGTPIVWGGSPAIFDMKSATSALGAGESWLLGIAYAQIGRALGLPTGSFLGVSDAKTFDAQAGLESSSAILATLAGINLITGAGMLAQENCQSIQKLVFDAEVISQAKRLKQGILLREHPVALALLREIGHQGDFLTHSHTLTWFRAEFNSPSRLINRQSPEAWLKSGAHDAPQEANRQIDRLLDSYPGASLDPGLAAELHRIAASAASQAGLMHLPPLTP